MASGTITVDFSVSGEEPRLLAAWLRDEDELRGRVRIPSKPIQPGHMGGLVDVITVVLTGGTAPVFCRSLFSWLSRRREVQKVSLSLDPPRLSVDPG